MNHFDNFVCILLYFCNFFFKPFFTFWILTSLAKIMSTFMFAYHTTTFTLSINTFFCVFSAHFSFDFLNFENTFPFLHEKVNIKHGLFLPFIHFQILYMGMRVWISTRSLRLIDFNVVERLFLNFMKYKWLLSGIIFIKLGVLDSLRDSDTCFFSQSQIFVLDFVVDFLNDGESNLTKCTCFSFAAISN